MKRLIGILTLAVAAVSAMGSGADEAAVKAVHTQFEKAMVANDARTVKALVAQHFAPDFVHQLKGGQTENRDQFAKNMQMGGMMKFRAFKFTFAKASQTGNTMVIPVMAAIKVEITDGKGRVQNLAQMSSDIETWVKTSSGWKMKVMKSTK